jgi:hypothetical protein
MSVETAPAQAQPHTRGPGGAAKNALILGALGVVLSFEVKRLTDDVARAWSSFENGQTPQAAKPSHVGSPHRTRDPAGPLPTERHVS